MIQLIQLMVFGFLALSLVYVVVSIYSRSVRRERLEKQWDAAQGPGERRAFIEAGMVAYQKSLRRRLIWLVYVIPAVAISVIVYLLNFH
ncbi:MAG: hypothetical protein KF887_04010 [Paracoccaceae bacterium]|nr:MAG: hypothetical protein KF887_04010 [Paracoccaceae bacterium]